MVELMGNAKCFQANTQKAEAAFLIFQTVQQNQPT